ncbi:lysylphosphatidylglycerol synthase transmembrane domain-containing protein [Rathayibacter soli]|uniref:lysylphosphatidylglycerol synthase transmembrane domain-containing protein n=1 Tax=Rathayibacter soli TaxID=3144168 RepID=UPI0027E5161B|nr:lysylphosphatidylglycerol synthase transmembrane domain-containing protein [Glaciibacter superstes]
MRLVVGGGVLLAVVIHVGAEPFLRGLRSLDGPTISAAVVLVAIATAAASWRWRLIASRLGVEVGWSSAIAMYYQSQFLNTVLPGGVIGDVHRAVSHGQRAQRIGQASRAVAIERTAGQVVQLALALMILLGFGAAFGGYVVTALAVGATALAVAVLAAIVLSAHVRVAFRHELAELRVGLGSARTSCEVVIASVVVVACHVATFAIATSAIGEHVPPLQLLTLAFVVMLGGSIPLNVGGWGPREGIAGWAFALAGFGASAGVAAATLYGVLAMISLAPGAIVAVVFAVRRHEQRSVEAVTPHLPRRQENSS